jgi:hypothetical protein
MSSALVAPYLNHPHPHRLTLSFDMSSFYDLKADLPGGKTYDFDQLRGKVVLVVNVASQWSVNLALAQSDCQVLTRVAAGSLLSIRVLSSFQQRSSVLIGRGAGLQELYDKYKDKDFTIIGFPCNQFGGQEPGTDEDISSFCSLNHGESTCCQIHNP